MKKFLLGISIFTWLGLWTIFAQDNSILPDEAEINVKSPIIEWEATNLSVTMMKDGIKMSNYTGTIRFSIENENWESLKINEYTVPNWGIYSFLDTDLWFKEFQKWLEIKKEWTFYIQVEDMNDDDEKILWRQPITVIKNSAEKWNYQVDVRQPQPEASIIGNKLDILGSIPEMKNSKALIYIDDKPATTADIDSSWTINYSIPNLELWRHNLRIEVPDIEWNILWTSDKIYFTVVEWENIWIDVSIYPEKWLMVWDKIKVNVSTDEMVESVKMKLSDRPENDGLILTKDWLWKFSYNLYLIATWEVNISLETSTSNNSNFQMHENVKKFLVLDTPEISNITKVLDPENQSGTISWEIINWDPVSSYIIKYRVGSWDDTIGEEETNSQSFTFKEIPYDTEINFNVTPVRKNSLNLPTHWAASETIQFIIRKPEPDWEQMVATGVNIDIPRCTVQNIATQTTKIWDNYYLVWDKVKNVTKYIVYSSASPDGKDKVKVYETSDTSYEYPFDYNSKEDQFMYFRIVWICDDWQELELTWATKVQVWPAENFFLLLCLTFLIYFWIKLFRETEV